MASTERGSHKHGLQLDPTSHAPLEGDKGFVKANRGSKALRSAAQVPTKAPETPYAP